MKTRIGVVIIILVATALGAGQGVDYVASKRKMMEQLAKMQLECIAMDAKNAELGRSVNSELGQILKSLPSDTGKTTGELMNPDQANRFGRLSQKQQFFNAKSLFISKRERDLEVVEDMFEWIISEFEQTKRLEKHQRTEKENEIIASVSDFLGSVIMERADKVSGIKTVADGVNSAFGDIIMAVGDMMEVRGEKLRIYQERFEKQRGSKFSVAELTEMEKAEYLAILEPVRLALNAHSRLLGLRLLYALMTMDNNWALEEIAASAGDLDAVGRKMDESVAKASEEVKTMVGIVRAINDKIPCRWVKDMKVMEERNNFQRK